MRTLLKFRRSDSRRRAPCARGAAPGHSDPAICARIADRDHAGTLAPTRMPATQNPRALSDTKEVP